jgi:hypothetical protein
MLQCRAARRQGQRSECIQAVSDNCERVSSVCALVSVPIENLELSEPIGVIFSFVILADAHFSHPTPGNFALALRSRAAIQLENFARGQQKWRTVRAKRRIEEQP